MRNRITFLSLLLLLYTGNIARAQSTLVYTEEDYDRAADMLGANLSKLVDNSIRPQWLSDDLLWYRSQAGEESIYKLLKSAQETVSNAHNGLISPVLCGIGITSSDVPIIFELFKRYHILTNSEAFAFQNKFRVVDLSQLTIGAFNNSSNFLYPNTKSKILNKFLHGKSFEPGKTVWEQYESKNYTSIESRVIDELASTYLSYKHIKCQFDNFKALERKVNNLEKLNAKYREQLGLNSS